MAAAFFRSFRHRSDAALVCEPRHPSWFTARAEDLFERHQVSRIAADPAHVPAAATPGAKAAWPYWRWHGAPRMYYSDYSNQALQALARQVQTYRRNPHAPWLIFDNTAHGFAVANAARLQNLLSAQTNRASQQEHTHA